MSSAPGLAPVSPPALGHNPFPGLRPFYSSEAHLFFGRETQIDGMIDKLRPHRFLAIVGGSGSGKSSLVNCGLRPALHRGLMSEAGTAWRVAQFRPGDKPIRALARSLAAPGVLFPGESETGVSENDLTQMIEETLSLSALGVMDLYRQAYPEGGVNLLLVADQFEELFRYRRLSEHSADQYRLSDESTAFVRMLLEASEQRQCPIYVVLTMRSDFLGDCAQFDGLPEAINQGQYLVPRMTRAERRLAIEGPSAVARGKIGSVLLTKLVNDVGDNPDQLSILQHALNRTWARASHDVEAQNELLPAHYVDIGSMAGALDRHAEKAWAELQTPRQQQICEKVFRALTDKGTDQRGTRRPTRFSELCAIAEASGEEVTAVLAVFRKPSRSFLMPPAGEKLEDDTVIDISHESLMRIWERLRGWADQEASSARMWRRLAETAALYEAQRVDLIHGREMDALLEWWEKQKPNRPWAAQYSGQWDSVISLFDKSRAARHREMAEAEFERRWLHRWRPAVLGTALALVLVLAFGIKWTPVDDARNLVNWALRQLQPLIKVVLDKEPTGDRVEYAAVFLVVCLGLTVLFAGYVVVSWGGRRVYRFIAFEKILTAISSPPPAKPREPDASADEAVSAAAAPEPYAGFLRRLAAFVIDILVFIAIYIVVFVVSRSIEMGSSSFPEMSDDVAILMALILPFVCDWLYQALLTSSRWQATLGMRAMGIVVTDQAGRRLSFGRATARYFAKLLSWVTSFIGFLMQPFTKRKQALHDKIAGCLVVRRRRAPAGHKFSEWPLFRLMRGVRRVPEST